MSLNKILVPIDGSDASFRALNLAVELGEKFGSELLLLCVYRHHSPLEASLSMVHSYASQKPDEAMSDYAKQLVEKAKQHAASTGALKIRGFIENGQPARSIVDFADKHSVDLIAMGSRGIGDIGGFLLGSVSHKVTSLAKCACLTVK